MVIFFTTKDTKGKQKRIVLLFFASISSATLTAKPKGRKSKTNCEPASRRVNPSVL